MSGPGETEKIGTVIDEQELAIKMLTHGAAPHPLVTYTTPQREEYTFAIIERCGFAIYSKQDPTRVYVLDFVEFIKAARTAGLDAHIPLIIVPGGSEVFRG